MVLRAVIFVLLLTLSHNHAFAEKNSINFLIPPELTRTTPVIISVDDAVRLLQQSFPHNRITKNKSNANVEIRLTLTAAKVIRLHKPPFKASYSVESAPSAEGVAITVSASTPEGISNGIYALLQHKLGFRFYHPKNTYIPIYDKWPLPTRFTMNGQPLFNNIGFHLHTMHPIELTEPLFNPNVPFGTEEVKQYIDWLARNGQNTWQFWILRTANREKWPAYAEKYVRYAHDRGIRTGAVISLSTLQQKAFQAISLLKPELYKRQIDKNLKWLMQVPFDYVCIDFTMGEYLPDLAELMPRYKKYMMDEIHNRYGREVFENTHVIKRKPSPSPQYSGVLIHSVMFYSLTDTKAPVYGNSNIRFMLDMLKKDTALRRTWYWPESSYWVTFDTSVPLFLLPYLSSRHDDIELLKNEDIDGHITFTSGWEWGYWITDYSIAQWCWQITDDGRTAHQDEDFVLTELFGDKSKKLWHQAFLLQQKYLKDDNLISLTAAKTPFQELPYPFNRSFQPGGGYSLFRSALPFWGRKYREGTSAQAKLLDDFGKRFMQTADALAALTPPDNDFMKDTLRSEIINAMRITALRAMHREHTLLAGAYRNVYLPDSSEYFYDCQLRSAKDIRKKAEQIVKTQELIYRYPISMIARRADTHTAYGFGYLYPVSDLYFWKREEKQAERGRFDAFFMNIWSFFRTLGLDGLF